MGFLESLDRLEKNSEYLNWTKENKTSYLVHGFVMEDKMVKPEWQIGYYIPEHDKIVTFNIGKKIVLNPESEVLKKEKKIYRLNVDKIKIAYVEALKTANQIQKDEFPAHQALKKIFIIQNLEGKQIWNITFVTHTFNTLNIKIDSETGEVVNKKLLSIFRVEK